MARKPVDQLEVGRQYYSRRMAGLDTDYYGTLWHLFTVGHLVTVDLDRVARGQNLSFADLDFLGALSIDPNDAPRAVDLASALYLSKAAVSTRVARLEKAGLIECSRGGRDKRALVLRLTQLGSDTLEQAIRVIAEQSQIVRFYKQLPPDDRRALTRILGELHQRYDREFAGTSYSDG